MTKYLVTKATKITRRNARRAKESARVDWTRRDDDKPARKLASGAARRMACIVLAVSFLPMLAYYGASPTYARGSGGWGHTSGESAHRSDYQKNNDGAEKNTR